MNAKEYIEKEIEKLSIVAEEIERAIEEDFNPCDWSGGNYDDAYAIGVEHGEVGGNWRFCMCCNSF
jgi:hypothetical protein